MDNRLYEYLTTYVMYYLLKRIADRDCFSVGPKASESLKTSLSKGGGDPNPDVAMSCYVAFHDCGQFEPIIKSVPDSYEVTVIAETEMWLIRELLCLFIVQLGLSGHHCYRNCRCCCQSKAFFLGAWVKDVDS
ncbi:hypothetical protein TNCV_3967321 [Trichonephila clavipes]|nr:hypothetical protein TNCV_3967321 [Trichonephila clavipes]